MPCYLIDRRCFQGQQKIILAKPYVNMIPIFYGTKQVTIGMGEFLIKCPSCEKHSWAEILVTSKYYHVYGLPMMPEGKEANIIFNSCGLKRYGLPFDADLIGNFNEVKSAYRQPWFVYKGLAISILPIMTVILARIL